MSERKPYKTDVSDEQWALVEPVIAAWKAAHPSVSGHQGPYAMREIVNALLYQGRTGCQWELLPQLGAGRVIVREGVVGVGVL
ncbi:transposase, partial [Streptomyces sp. NPDC007162]|uniref:transposase n=1 Tax=Streptomyces sp. NPDC007162 TaxID=3156917 RepID=UPI003408C037